MLRYRYKLKDIIRKIIVYSIGAFFTETIESVGAKPLVHLLLHSHGGWPMLTPKWNESYFDWKNVSASIRTQLGLDLFFRVETQIDPKNKDQNIIAVLYIIN